MRPFLTALFIYFWSTPSGTWDLRSQPGIKERVPPAVEVRSLNHCTIREVPWTTLFKHTVFPPLPALPRLIFLFNKCHLITFTHLFIYCIYLFIVPLTRNQYQEGKDCLYCFLLCPQSLEKHMVSTSQKFWKEWFYYKKFLSCIELLFCTGSVPSSLQTLFHYISLSLTLGGMPWPHFTNGDTEAQSSASL